MNAVNIFGGGDSSGAGTGSFFIIIDILAVIIYSSYPASPCPHRVSSVGIISASHQH